MVSKIIATILIFTFFDLVVGANSKVSTLRFPFIKMSDEVAEEEKPNKTKKVKQLVEKEKKPRRSTTKDIKIGNSESTAIEEPKKCWERSFTDIQKAVKQMFD